jgi:hypothetical protein
MNAATAANSRYCRRAALGAKGITLSDELSMFSLVAALALRP